MALTEDYDYDLPPASIAQHPMPKRDESRLLVMERAAHSIRHAKFRDLADFLDPCDLLVVNDSRVVPARCRAMKLSAESTQGSLPSATAPPTARLELLAVEEVAPAAWWVMLKPGKRVRAGTRIQLLNAAKQPIPVIGQVMDKSPDGLYLIQFAADQPFRAVLEQVGEVPLPPYIQASGRDASADRDRYQTVYAQIAGSVAAPTAGLHFTPSLFAQLQLRGIEVARITLHVGLATFAPVKTERLEDHIMHVERFDIPPETADRITATRRRGGRVVAVGTTTLRALESATDDAGQLMPGPQSTRLFVRPPWRFRQVDALITNFHLPCSTLLMLVSAFAAPGTDHGRQWILDAYRLAIAEGYRFYSYGDAMLIL